MMLVTKLSVLITYVMASGLTAVITWAAVLAGTGKSQAGPAATGEPAAQVLGRPFPEQFLVIDGDVRCSGRMGRRKNDLTHSPTRRGHLLPMDTGWPSTCPNRTRHRGNGLGKLVIQSRVRPKERTTVPLVWGTTGSSIQLMWSFDSQRILICEQGHNEDGSRGSAYRVYDLNAKSLTELKLPKEWWPSDWSADGKRVLTSLRTDGDTIRVVWVNLDGTGKPEFITSEEEVAYGARLSPDGRRILCMVGPKELEGERNRLRLHVIDLITKKRTRIDRPGHTYGYCWSSDGSKVAYTWQMPLRQPNEIVERRTYLITCDPDGSNRKTVTSRKYEVPENSSGRGGMTIFFQVVAWWR